MKTNLFALLTTAIALGFGAMALWADDDSTPATTLAPAVAPAPDVAPVPALPVAAGVPPVMPVPAMSPIQAVVQTAPMPAYPVPQVPLSEPAPVRPKVVKDSNPPQQVKIFQLANADAVELADLLKPFVKATIAADKRSNSIIISGGAEELAVAEALMQRLDQQEPARAAANNASTRAAILGKALTGVTSSSTSSGSSDTPGKPAPKPEAGSATTGGGGRGGFGGGGGFSGGGFSGEGGGGRGGFGAIFGSADSAADYAAVATALDRQVRELREAEGAAKRADEKLKELTDLLKQHHAMANQNDESGKVYQRMVELVDEQRRAAEDQRRAAEDARRKAEEARRKGESTSGKLLELYQLQKTPSEPKAVGALRKYVTQPDTANKEINDAVLAYRKKVSEPAGEANPKELIEIKSKIGELLEKQFEERQKAEASELKQLRERLDRLENEINERKNGADSLKRRLDDLLSTKAEPEPRKLLREMVIKRPDGTEERIVGERAIIETDGDSKPKTLTITGNNVVIKKPAVEKEKPEITLTKPLVEKEKPEPKEKQ